MVEALQEEVVVESRSAGVSTSILVMSTSSPCRKSIVHNSSWAAVSALESFFLLSATSPNWKQYSFDVPSKANYSTLTTTTLAPPPQRKPTDIVAPTTYKAVPSLEAFTCGTYFPKSA
jgi:hypothetical protein